MAAGVPPVSACQGAVAQALTDDPEMLASVNELSSSLF
jgi:nitric oxide reductase NorQ protein